MTTKLPPKPDFVRSEFEKTNNLEVTQELPTINKQFNDAINLNKNLGEISGLRNWVIIDESNKGKLLTMPEEAATKDKIPAA